MAFTMLKSRFIHILPVVGRSVAPGLLTLLISLEAAAAVLHVSPEGSDANPGTRKAPLASPAGARDRIRQMRSAGKQVGTVELHAGTYYLREPLVFENQDSGSARSPIVYRAAPGESVTISGGGRLQPDWTPGGRGIFKTKVPPNLITDQLFVNGQRQTLARYPDFDPKQRILGGFAKDAISPSRASRWADPSGGFLHVMHRHEWGDAHYRITRKNPDGTVTLEGGWQNNRAEEGIHETQRFVENIFEELDAPGEWFLNSRENTLFFKPPSGFNLKQAIIEVPVFRHIVEFRGTAERPVRFLRLEGVTLRHTLRSFMENREPLLRSDWTTYRGGAVLFEGAEDCVLKDATLTEVGGNGVFVSGYARRITLKNCEIDRAGANSVAFVGRTNTVRSPLFNYHRTLPVERLDLSPGPKAVDYPADCLVEDCLLTSNGRVEKQTAGVQIAMASRITVRHCSIYDCPRAGINIGDGCWGGHVIEYCDVFDTVKETGDHGSFNSWGRDRYWVPNIKEVDQRVNANPSLPLLDVVEPITLRNNRWRCDHGWDIDLDDGSTRFVLENNLCLNGGIKLREGFQRRVENNVMINNSFHPHVWFARSGDIFRHNIVMAGYYPIGMPKIWGQEVNSNLLPNAAALAQAHELGVDSRSQAGDPAFRDPARGDFQVKSGSPALAIGFKNFPMDRFGVQAPRLRAHARKPLMPAVLNVKAVDSLGVKKP